MGKGDYELSEAIEKYKDWVILNFVKEELLYESQKRHGEHEKTISLSYNTLLKVRCTSMAVPGMTVNIMKEQIDQLVKKEWLASKQIPLPQINPRRISRDDEGRMPDDQAETRFELTPEGSLKATQKFKVFYHIDEINQLDVDAKNYPKFVKNFTDKLSKKLINERTIDIRVWAITETLLNFYLIEYLPLLINIPKN